MIVRNRLIVLSRLAAMLAIVLSLLPASPISAASRAAPAPAVSPASASVAERASNPELRYASLWPASLQAAAQPASSAQPARSPDAPVITATKTDFLQNDIPPAGPTAGDTIRYTITAVNSGSDPANGVTFSDTIDPGTTLSGVAHVSPIAFNDSYTSLGNVGITAPAANGVLANDVDPDSSVSLSVIAGAGATSQGGAFAIAADGSFSYSPPAGYEGPDSFSYTLTDNDPLTPNDTGTVNITVNDVIWFIQNTAAAGGDGRLSAPFNSISAFNSFAADQTGDIIFVFEGVGSYPGAFTLLASQQLIGQGVALGAAAGLTVPPFSNPLPGATANSLLTNLSGNSIALGNDNVIKGLTVGNTSGTGISGPFGFGTLTVRNVAISGSGAALDLATGTLDAIFDNIASNAASAAGWAISLNAVGGSLAVSNPGAGTDTGITSAGYGGISIINAPAGASYNFGETSVGSSDVGVLIQGNNAGATTTFAVLSITVSNGQGVSINNAGVITIGGSGSTISATNGSAMVVNGQANFGGGATFASVSSANGPTGVNLIMTGVTGSITMNGGAITGSTSAGVAVSGGSANVTYGGSITNSFNRSASIIGRTGGAVTISGTINDSGSGILVQNNTGGSTTFSGNSKTINTGASKGVTLSSNAGHTINFSGGGLAITTTSGAGFEATGGAAGINVTGANNTVSSTTGRAIDVANTTIGSSGMTFRSVSSGASGTAGISLNNTGTLGGLSVTGSGATAGSGGSISGKTGDTDGVTLNNTKNTSLAYMNINNNSRNGIYGLNVNGLTLTGVMLDGNANQFTPDEAGLLLEEVSGVVTISNTTVRNSFEHNVKVINFGSTPTTFNVTGGTIGPNPVGTGAQGLLFQGTSTANMTLNVNGTLFTGNLSNGIFADSAGGTMDVTIQNSTFTNNNVGPGVSVSSSGNMTFDILNNIASSPTQAQSIGINVFANASHTGTFVGTISNNTVGQVGSVASGSIDGSGIAVRDEGGGTVTVLINNNTVREVGNGAGSGFEGIFVINSVTAGTLNATVTNNTMDQIRDDRGLLVRSIFGTVCSDIRGNQFSNIGGSDFLRVSQAAPGVFNLVQTSQANLSTVNNGATTTVSGAINFGASGSCPIPASAPESPDASSAAGQPAASSSNNASQPRAASRPSAFNLPTDQPAAPVSSAPSPAPAAAASQSTGLPVPDTSAGSRGPESGETINVNIGTLPAGKSVTIVFDVIIDTPTTPQQIVSQVCNQGEVSATDLPPVLTDDPDVGGSADPTCTAMQPGAITIAKDQIPNGSDIFGFTSTIPGNAAFNVNGDTSLPIANVVPGSYTVTENDPLPQSFNLNVLVCSDSGSSVASTVSLPSRTATVNLEPGETITCTFTNQSTTLGVTLADFSAACQMATPVITWETVSELQNQGFNLYRGLDAANPDTQLNTALIPSQGPGSAQGYTYTWIDDTAAPATEYFFWLEDVDFAGTTTMHGPISILCSTPTAVRLSGLSATTRHSPLPAGAPLAALPAVASLALAAAWATRRRRE